MARAYPTFYDTRQLIVLPPTPFLDRIQNHLSVTPYSTVYVADTHTLMEEKTRNEAPCLKKQWSESSETGDISIKVELLEAALLVLIKTSRLQWCLTQFSATCFQPLNTEV